MKRAIEVMIFVLLLPVLIITFPWWGTAYYRSVIN